MWRFIATLFGFLFVLVVFLVPESVVNTTLPSLAIWEVTEIVQYQREARFNTDLGATIAVGEAINTSNKSEGEIKSSLEEEKFASAHNQKILRDSKKAITYFTIRQLLPWSGYKGQENLFKIFLRPFPFLLSPVAFYGIFICAFSIVKGPSFEV